MIPKLIAGALTISLVTASAACPKSVLPSDFISPTALNARQGGIAREMRHQAIVWNRQYHEPSSSCCTKPCRIASPRGVWIRVWQVGVSEDSHRLRTKPD